MGQTSVVGAVAGVVVPGAVVVVAAVVVVVAAAAVDGGDVVAVGVAVSSDWICGLIMMAISSTPTRFPSMVTASTIS